MKVIHGATADQVSRALTEPISAHIQKNQPTLLLLSGGSTIPFGMLAIQRLAETLGGNRAQLNWLLTISQIDERYGPIGHADSNWQHLCEAGFTPSRFSTVPILRSVGSSAAEAEATTMAFRGFLARTAAREASGDLFVVALLGVGKDGNTAGILAESPAAAIPLDADLYATGYKSALFTRITITPPFFKHLDLAVVWAAGEEKRPIIESLANERPYAEQPAQLLKQARETVIFTD